MGLLRLYLALAVLNVHYTFWDDQYFPFAFPAVCAFFVISGFYMSVVLSGKYGGKIAVFYVNRILRIYPICFVVLALTVAGDYSGILVDVPGINAIHNHFTGVPMPLSDRLTAMLNSAAMFPGVLWRAVFGFPPNLSTLTVVAPQLYTVGIELCFYAVAPFLLLQKGWRLFAVVLIAVVCHFAPLFLGAPERPYQYEYLPAVMVFFMLGRISFALLLRIERWRYPRWTGWLFLAAIVAYAHSFWTPLVQHISNTPETLGFYALVCVATPFLFLASRTSKIDRLIGDLSYPVYACQFMVIAFANGLTASAVSTRHTLALVVILSLSVVLVVTIDYPIDRLRQRIAKRARTSSERPVSHDARTCSTPADTVAF